MLTIMEHQDEWRIAKSLFELWGHFAGQAFFLRSNRAPEQ